MIQTQMTGHNVQVTPALRETTEKKLKKLDAYLDIITNIHITFNVDHLDQIVEGTITLRGGSIHAKAQSKDMYSTLDELIDKLLKQVRKFKEKLKDHHKHDRINNEQE